MPKKAAKAKKITVYRKSTNGEFTTKKYAKEHKAKTEKEHYRRKPKS